MGRASDPRTRETFVDYQIPAVVRCRTSEGRATVARLVELHPDALFVDTTHGELPYGERVHVAFVTDATPLVQLSGRVVSVVRGRGVRIEVDPDTPRDVLDVVCEWAEGRPATVCFPADPSSGNPSGPPPVPSSDPHAARLSGRRVLVIDDDPLVLRALERLLGYLGAEVSVARDSPEGLALASQKPLDVVLLDWMLPQVTGQKVLAELHRAHAGLPVAVISGGLWWEGAEAQLQGLGAGAVLRKPLDIDEVAAWIESVTSPDVSIGF